MKRTLTAVLGLLALMIAGLLLLVTNQSVGSGQASLAMTSSPEVSTPPVAATLSYSEFLTLAAIDIWSLHTPMHTPVIPTERPSLPRPTSEPVTPHPTPTFLPDRGIRMTAPVEIPIASAWGIAEEAGVRLIYPDLDGHVLVGVVDRGDRVAVVAINLESQQAQVLVEETQAWVYEPRISGRYVAWTVSWHDGAQDVLQVYDLQTDRISNVVEGARVHEANISGNTAVWEQLGDGWDILGYDLIRGEAFHVVTRPGHQMAPLMSEHWVVYQDTTDGDGANIALYVVNMDTGEDIRLGTVFYSSSQYVPSLYAIDAPWVAWSTEATLHFYNLETHITHSVTVEACLSPTSRPENLSLSENVLIFTCGQWLGYDIERDVFFSLPVYRADIPNVGFEGWDISRDRVVWVLTEDAYGAEERGHIYTAQIERSP